jgi:hypothetical protein
MRVIWPLLFIWPLGAAVTPVPVYDFHVDAPATGGP